MNNVNPSRTLLIHLNPASPSLPSSSATTAAGIRPCGQVLNLDPRSAASAAAARPHDFPPLLKACASFSLLPLGRALHQRAIILGLAADPHLATSLLHMYAMNRRVSDARRVFDGMPDRNVVSWTAIIAAYSRSADANMAFSMYNKMQNEGILPNSVTLLGLLAGISELGQVQCLHASIVKYGFQDDLVLINSIINVYSICGAVEFARVLFDSMPLRDTITWNSMLAGYCRIEAQRDSFELFHRMRLTGFFPDQQTYGSLLASSIINGSSIHALIITSGFGSDAHLVTSLVSFYLNLGNLEYAFELFDRSPEKDVVIWTALISGLAQNDRASQALFFFHRMSSAGFMPGTAAIASALSACSQLNLYSFGASIHGFVLRQQLPLVSASGNSLITMYAKSSRLKQCHILFNSMKNKDLVSWNAVISGFARNLHVDEAFRFFSDMLSLMERPDSITVVSLFQGCSFMGALRQGKLLHCFIIRFGLNVSISTETSLVDMYAKCGDLEAARRVFDEMPRRDLISWSAIIEGYGSHGLGKLALSMFSSFLSTGMEPNDVMLLSVLSSCSHSGMVSEGLSIFDSMKEEFKVEPRIEHCACVVDLLCRAGNVEEALKFYREKMPRASADVLGIVLDACRTGGLGVMAEEIGKEMSELKPESAGSYVQLAHNYAAMKRWDGVGEVLARMRSLGLKKTPAWSFVEVDGSKHFFYADHASHHGWEEIVYMLKVLESELRDTNDHE
ncbi:Pentatricopeptide repeat-containing protein [Apostasia shenzhenica]|uniref:Pentatricopeptide repeat-containing protein n=1 Tax=Apostasia shenzhenica TaxID=1088818 RepID=A0A2I0A3A4_9ASPA|nr:Pentatricopeptide repeat-containing protein [Apostasia shenzhenica]